MNPLRGGLLRFTLSLGLLGWSAYALATIDKPKLPSQRLFDDTAAQGKYVPKPEDFLKAGLRWDEPTQNLLSALSNNPAAAAAYGFSPGPQGNLAAALFQLEGRPAWLGRWKKAFRKSGFHAEADALEQKLKSIRAGV